MSESAKSEQPTPGNLSENDSHPGPVSKSRMSKLLEISRRTWLVIALVAWFSGTVLQLVFRDQFAWTAPFFYALPWPIVVAFGGLASVCLRTRLRAIRRILIAVVAIQFCCWTYGSFSFAQPDVAQPQVRFMLWNICRGLLGYENIAQDINASGADVVALVEATYEAQSTEFWETHCPQYKPYRLRSGMMILVKGQVTSWDHGNVKTAARYRHINIDIEGKRFALVLVDVVSDPLVVRRPAIQRLKQIASEHRATPLLVAGDFNTPPESSHFDELREELDKAFEVCGEGYRETWPVVAPVLDLDQVWGNKKIQWQRCWRGWSTYSDHRPVFVEFAVQ